MKSFTIKNSKYSIELPALTFGTASFERKDSDDIYFELLDTYYKHGGRCIDTARSYCDWLEDGLDSSEGAIGRWLKERSCRDEMIICTKGGHPNRENMEISRLSREELEYDLNRSLEVLGVDYVDVFFLHRDDEYIPVSEIMPILNDFYKSGRVHFLGASNWTSARIEEANNYAAENDMEPFRVSQINYSLAHSSTDTFGDPTVVCMNLREFKWYQRNQFPVMAYCPQAKGFFAKLARGDTAKNLPEGQFTSTANLARLARVKQLSEKEGIPAAVIPLGYLNSQPFFVSSVFAASKAWQIDEDMTAQDPTFDYKTIAFLENIL
ncbi:MAG: aldo/keto reductase [Ruminococcus sp.]|nr:aldo/keto reductase [Ruminococcus sp.]